MKSSHWALRELIRHGIITLVGAVLAMSAVRGMSASIVLLFGLPVTLAWFKEKTGRTEQTRWAARSFLLAIGIGSLLAAFPQVFPALGGFAKGIGGYTDRVLSFYIGIYLGWAFGVVPITLFRDSLSAASRGETPQFSKTTCYLGLAVSVILCIGMPNILLTLGFWPFF